MTSLHVPQVPRTGHASLYASSFINYSGRRLACHETLWLFSVRLSFNKGSTCRVERITLVLFSTIATSIANYRTRVILSVKWGEIPWNGVALRIATNMYIVLQ